MGVCFLLHRFYLHSYRLYLLSACTFPPRTPDALPPFFVSFQSLFQFSDLSRKFRNSTDGYIVPLSHVYPSLSRIHNPFNCSTFTFENFLSKIFHRHHIWKKLRNVEKKRYVENNGQRRKFRYTKLYIRNKKYPKNFQQDCTQILSISFHFIRCLKWKYKVF